MSMFSLKDFLKHKGFKTKICQFYHENKAHFNNLDLDEHNYLQQFTATSIGQVCLFVVAELLRLYGLDYSLFMLGQEAKYNMNNTVSSRAFMETVGAFEVFKTCPQNAILDELLNWYMPNIETCMVDSRFDYVKLLMDALGSIDAYNESEEPLTVVERSILRTSPGRAAGVCSDDDVSPPREPYVYHNSPNYNVSYEGDQQSFHTCPQLEAPTYRTEEIIRSPMNYSSKLLSELDMIDDEESPFEGVMNLRYAQSSPIQSPSRSCPSSRRSCPSPRRSSPSPRGSYPSPRRSCPSPMRSSPSPRRSSPSPRRSSPSPMRSSPSPRSGSARMLSVPSVSGRSPSNVTVRMPRKSRIPVKKQQPTAQNQTFRPERESFATRIPKIGQSNVRYNPIQIRSPVSTRPPRRPRRLACHVENSNFNPVYE